MNINKLFPRLSIRLKLAIAFALLAIVPLAGAALFATQMFSRQLRVTATTTLEHDLELAQQQTAGRLQQVERDVEFLAAVLFRPLLMGATTREWAMAEAWLQVFLGGHPSLFQIKVVDENGVLRFVRSADHGRVGGSEGDGSGFYYAAQAAALGPGSTLVLPIELRADVEADSTLATIPAIAVVVPVHEPDSVLAGAVVGEAYATVLFDGIEDGSPSLQGTTGLIGSDGLYLYHSSRKRDWGSLLASRDEVDLADELSEDIARALRAGASGTFEAADSAIVRFLPLWTTATGAPAPVLYRIVPLSQLEASVVDFRRWVSLGALIMLGAVIGLATVGARQFTEPIYRLRRSAERLARGQLTIPVRVETNDELEDLAAEFTAMADQLTAHRQNLEGLVEERTQALRQTHAELSHILERSADAIIGLDLDQRVRVWNRGAEELFGYKAAEALNRNVADLLSSGPSAEQRYIAREVERRGAVVNLNTERKSKDGERIALSLTQTLIRDQDGEPFGYSLILRDTRDQKRLEEHLRRSERIAAVSVMAAGIAHELNNPIAVIGNRLECMEDEIRQRCSDEDGDFLVRDLSVLREHVGRLGEVTRDLLSLARNQESNEWGLVALDNVAARLARVLERTFSSRNIGLDAEIAEGLPQVSGSEPAIETVCLNLLLNAADATPSGGKVTLTIRRSADRSAVEIIVDDTGSGVPEELRHRIFEPFFTTKTSGRGTGLGLAVCRSIIDRHDGEIWVEDRAHGGTRFVVSLPLPLQETAWTERES